MSEDPVVALISGACSLLHQLTVVSVLYIYIFLFFFCVFYICAVFTCEGILAGPLAGNLHLSLVHVDPYCYCVGLSIARSHLVLVHGKMLLS